MNNPLANYSVNDLQRLGGLKEHCSAPLLCVAHGLNVPCDLCELEEEHSAVCTACYKLFKEYPVVTLNRPCASIAQFQAQGVIAFEDEARAALEEQARPREAETLQRQKTAPSQQHRGSQVPKVRRPEATAHKHPVIEEHRRPKDEPARSVTPKPDKAETAKAERPEKARSTATDVYPACSYLDIFLEPNRFNGKKVCATGPIGMNTSTNKFFRLGDDRAYLYVHYRDLPISDVKNLLAIEEKDHINVDVYGEVAGFSKGGIPRLLAKRITLIGKQDLPSNPPASESPPSSPQSLSVEKSASNSGNKILYLIIFILLIALFWKVF